jgi:GT2 family glycosyltransferase
MPIMTTTHNPLGQGQNPDNRQTPHVELSVVVVSFNTRDLLRRSLRTMQTACAGLAHEIIVVDNASHDGSADMVAAEFEHVKLVRAPHNLGFAAANNLGRQWAEGEFLALINPDAFPEPGVLANAVTRLRQLPKVGMVGGLLIGKEGQLEPSARLFPSPLNDLLALSGLAARFAGSRFFGRFDRTWADPMQPAQVDWVPGAYCLVRQAALEKTGFFDERFFLYYEEVDLCRRLKQAGYTVEYWPELRATHWGGESSKTVGGQTLSGHGRQLTLWRMRSALLYYRKHHGWLVAKIAASLEVTWHTVRQWRNRQQPAKQDESASVIQTMRRAWRDTLGGRVSPPTPW